LKSLHNELTETARNVRSIVTSSLLGSKRFSDPMSKSLHSIYSSLSDLDIYVSAEFMTLLVEFPLATDSSLVKLPAISLQQQMSTPSKADVEFTFASNGHSTHAPPPTPADGVPSSLNETLGSDDRLLSMLTNVSRQMGSSVPPPSVSKTVPLPTPTKPRSSTGSGGGSTSKPPSGMKSSHTSKVNNNTSRVSTFKTPAVTTHGSNDASVSTTITTPLPKVHSWNRLTPSTSENDVNVKSKTSFLDIQNEQSKS